MSSTAVDDVFTAVTSSAPNGTADDVMHPDVIQFEVKSVPIALVTSVLLGVVILAAITGNCFIVAAILRERHLNGVQNRIVMSLAVADLMVALLVMPFAVLDLISKQWFLGDIACQLFISLDVVCCTSSILHLVCIALDRYWSVTRPEYSLNRSTARINGLIAGSWIISILVSLPPVLPLPITGWSDAVTSTHVTGECVINQNMLYTVFSTVSAFYIPLLAIIVIYAKIYQAATQRLHRGPLATYRQIATLAPGMVSKLAERRHQAPAGERKHAQEKEEALIATTTCSDVTNARPSNGQTQKPLNGNGFCADSSVKRDTIVGRERIEEDSTQPCVTSSLVTRHTDTDTYTCVADVMTMNEGSASSERLELEQRERCVVSPATETTCDSIDAIEQIADDANPARSMMAVSASRRRKINDRRERKAFRTLTIITGTFIACWLPFFVWSLIRPFVSHLYQLPPALWSFFVWLGYFNSVVNPVLYTTFNPDFRNAFKRMCPRLYPSCSRS